MLFVCPLCQSELAPDARAYRCQACAREFPIIGEIPDFRVAEGPYISNADDRAKAVHLMEAARGRSFEQLVRYYYEITPELPRDMTERWTAHMIAGVEIARRQILGFEPEESLLDIGCGTAPLLAAAAAPRLFGVDIAMRWLAIGRARLREEGIDATLVCANAEHLPFRPGAFATTSIIDTIEHLASPEKAISEARRVCNRSILCVTNNRYAPVPEPHLKIWGVGFLPRRWQKRFVSRMRPGIKPYEMTLVSRWELRRQLTRAGFERVVVEPEPLCAPHLNSGRLQTALRLYNRILRWPLVGSAMSVIGPRLRATARIPRP